MSKITDGLRGILNTFISWLPEGANKANTSDTGNVSKTSPTLFDYDVFKINWDKVTTLRDIDEMIKSDTRLKRSNSVFASTAVKRGLSIKVTSDVDEALANQAQDIIDELMRNAQINSKLRPWAKSLRKDGELYLNPIIDPKKKMILDIKNLPAITMQRNEDITGRFPDLNDAFRQIDPISRQILQSFPLFSINHIRNDHESGQLYGNSAYLACRTPWRKLNMTEQDLVVRRRTRAVPRRLHSVGNKDNPGTWDEIDKYKEINKLNNPQNAAVTTDYFGNGLTDVKDLNGDGHLDHIKDIEHLQEVMMIGTGVPLHILGFGRNVNRDIVEDQKKQFEEDTQELRDLLEYGDESPFSGLRAIFDLSLILQSIDPSLVTINVMWAETDNDDVDKKVDRVVKLRAAQPEPLVSRKFALTYLGRDVGLENEEAVLAEIETIIEEMAEARAEQQAEAAMLNPEKPATSPTDKTTSQSSGKPVKDSKEKNPLHSSKVVKMEKQLADEVRSFFKKVLKTMIANGMEANIEKIGKLRTIHDSVQSYEFGGEALALLTPHSGCNCSQCMIDKRSEVQLSDLVEQYVIDELDAAWDEHSESIEGKITAHYLTMGKFAYETVAEQIQSGVSFEFVHSGVKQDLESAAAERINGIKETTKQLLRKELAQAYENAESVDQWVERIGKVMNIPDWRAEMISRTELAWAFNKSNRYAYEEAGVVKVRYLAVLDNRTCPTCRGYHNKVFDLHDAPTVPNHPSCRCTLAAEF